MSTFLLNELPAETEYFRKRIRQGGIKPRGSMIEAIKSSARDQLEGGGRVTREWAELARECARFSEWTRVNQDDFSIKK